MLKISPEFRIYDYSPRKAAKSLIQAGFINDDDLGNILTKVLKQNTMEWDAIVDKVFEAGVLRYHKVTLHTTPVVQDTGFPQGFSGGFPTLVVDKTTYYDVEGVNKPMTLSSINSSFNATSGNFVAICRKDADGKLELTGFVY